MAAGLPVIALGHPESSIVKVTSQYHVGLSLTDSNWDGLCGQLLAAFAEPNIKTKYRPEIQRCATAEFDAQRMRAVLYENFRKGASTFGP